MDRVTISKIETGFREVTDIEAKAIAEALGVTIKWLYDEDDNNTRKHNPYFENDQTKHFYILQTCVSLNRDL